MIYETGTIKTTAGQTKITGTGTKWKENLAGISEGCPVTFLINNTVYMNTVLSINSDTEINLAYPAPATSANIKYQIVTVLLDSMSDGARKMLANQLYIQYFLRNMDAWMTQDGIVEIKTPTGETVKLESIKALKALIDGKLDSSALENYATKESLKNITSQTIFARAEAIPQNADLNDYTNAGLFYQASSNPGANAKNYPPNSSAGSLEIARTGATSVKQIYTDWYDNKTYTRRYNGGNKTWVDKWDEDYTKLNPPTPAGLNVYSIPQADNKFQPKGNYQPAGNYQPKGEYVDKNSTQEQIIQGFLTATRRFSVEAPDKARAVLYAVTDGNVGISAQDPTGKWLGDIKHPANGKNGTLAIVEQLIGEGQSWVNVTSQRSSKVTYTNSTSRPIMVCITAYGDTKSVDFLVNNVVVGMFGYTTVTQIARPLTAIIPVGAKYKISDTIGSIYTWSELR